MALSKTKQKEQERLVIDKLVSQLDKQIEDNLKVRDYVTVVKFPANMHNELCEDILSILKHLWKEVGRELICENIDVNTVKITVDS